MRLLILIFLMSCNTIFGQTISGIVINEESKLPVEYVNIGIVKKNIGSVSDISGEYNLTIDSQFDDDTLLFSSIGYFPFSIKVSDLKKGDNRNIFLKEKVYEINEVIVKPRIFIQRTLGVTTRSKVAQAGFKENQLGYECGILMKINKSAILKKVKINFSDCSYDTIFYRLNIYKVLGELEFENILHNPIYLDLPKTKTLETVVVELESYNLTVQGSFLITLEHIKDLGSGHLYFNAGLSDKTYYKKTSQGEWRTVPVGISISVDADVEK